MRYYEHPSSVDERIRYEVTSENGEYRCDCPGFTIHGHCKHSKRIREFEQAGVMFLGEW